MRKSLLILFGLFCCLLFAGSETSCVAQEVIPMTQVSVDRASNDEWQCEWEYNSDLNLPRVGGETTTSLAMRISSSDAGRSSVARTAALLHAATLSQETTYRKPFNPVTGPCAIDYYVYKLRRLLI